MTAEVVVMLAGDPAVDPFAAGGASAAARLRAEGHRVDLRMGVPDALPDARVVVCHGVQFIPLVISSPRRGLIVGDMLPGGALPGVTAIDWKWDEAFREAGAAAARIAADARVGFIAGPPVPTQQRAVAAFADGLGVPPVVAHLPAFDDEEAGRRLGRVLVDELGCVLVAHSADAAGAAGMTAARSAGAMTFGFLQPSPADTGWVRSDIAGTVHRLVLEELAGRTLPEVFEAGRASGFGGFVADAPLPRVSVR